MEIIERFQVMRQHQRDHQWGRCNCDKLDEHLDTIQAELEQLLARIPVPDATPAHIILTAS